MSFDTKCLALAVVFLSDYPHIVARDDKAEAELAQRIQDAIEDFLQENGT